MEGEINLRIMEKDQQVWANTQTAQVDHYGKSIHSIEFEYPEKEGWYELEASFKDHQNEPVRSFRKFFVSL